MPDQFTEVTTTSWGQRLSRSLSGIIFGVAFFLLSFPLLWWNEGRSVERIKMLDLGRKTVVETSATAVDPSNNSKLVHIVGPATTPDILDDSLFGVRKNALKLKRIVETYQWKERQSGHSSNNMGGSQTRSTTYSYSKVWEEGVNDSSHFKVPQGHENPKQSNIQSRYLTARIHFGAFQLSNELAMKIDTYEDDPVTPQTYAAMGSQLKSYFKLNGSEYFYGDPANPQIGAIRVHYQIIRPGDISVIGRQDGDKLGAYDMRDPNGVPQSLPTMSQPKSLKEFFIGAWGSVDSNVIKNLNTIELLQMGDASADNMFTNALRQNSLMTWLIRGGGCFLMWFGLMALFNPIKVLADLVPFVGSLVGASLGLVTSLAAIVLSFLTIAAAWMYYRPMLGIGLLLLAAIAGYGIVHHMRDVRARRLAASVPPAPTAT